MFNFRVVVFSMVAQCSAAGAAFTLNILIARMLGASGAGLFFQGLMIANVGSVISRLGMDNVTTRFVATYFAEKNSLGIQQVVLVALKAGMMMAIFLLLVLFLVMPLFDVPACYYSMALAIPFLTFSAVVASAIRGIEMPASYTFIQRGLVPLFSSCALAIVWFTGVNVEILFVSKVYFLASVCVALFAYTIWEKKVCFRIDDKDKRSLSELFSWHNMWQAGRHLYVVSFLNLAVFPWVAILFLGLFTTSDQVGLFGVANRMTSQMGLIGVAIGNVVAPKFAAIYSKGDLKSLEYLARRSSMVSLAIALPFFLVLLIYHTKILFLFGAEFVEASRAFKILLFGQIVQLCTGNSGMLLQMSGYEREVKKVLIISSSILFLCTVSLTWKWGVLGAVWANVFALVVQGVLLTYCCMKHIGVNPLPGLGHYEG